MVQRMSTVKHTPGPWHVDATPGDTVPEFVYDAGGRGVADATRKSRTRREQLANARLIAAAPELLEALKALVERTDYAGTADFAMGEIELARKAIAKAIGVKP